MNKSLRAAVAASTFVSLSLTSTVFASGFALIDNSASGLGQAYAGAAAVAEDPSTIFFNPAGMMYLEGTQVTAGMHIIDSDAEFNDKGSTPVGGGDGGNAGDTFFVPNFYYVQDFGDKYKIGLGINAPFGLGTDFGDDWMGRYTSTKSDLETINFNPSISFRANEKLSVGLGMDIQYMKATLKGNVYQGALGMTDGRVKVTGDSWGLGFNGGFIYEVTPETRLGMHYRSKISQTLKGNVKFKNMHSLLGGDRKTHAEAQMDTPSTFSVSLTHQLNERLTLLSDVTFTEWSNFDELKIEDSSGNPIVPTVEEKWDDTYRVSLGMKYQYNKQWILRTGVAHDETPIDDAQRTSRIPGDDRTWLSFGASYSPSSDLTIDVGYAHLWVEDADIDEEYRLLTGDGELKGDFDSDVDILSVQATWKF